MTLFSGKKGESLFSEPLLRFFRENPLPELFKKTESLNDDRLLAIVTALIVEDRIDAALRAFLPKYTKLAERTDFTFSLKIALIEALAQIPPIFTRTATIIRKIRNEFAHNLNIVSFLEVKPALMTDLKNLRATAYGVGAEPLATLVEEYRAVAFLCISGLDTYRENMTYLAEHISTPEFIEALYKKCDEENQAEIVAILAEEPISVEMVDGNKIETYSKGLVNIIGGEGSGPVDLGKIHIPPAKNSSD
jgi:hypothetical protein